MVLAIPATRHGLPAGELEVSLPSTDSAWAECLRDFKRTLEGGGIFTVGRGQRHPLRDLSSKVLGDISREACDEALAQLSAAIQEEIVAQKWRPSSDKDCCLTQKCVRPPGHDGACVDDDCREVANDEGLDAQVLEQIVRSVVAHVSVALGMQAVLANALPPALWQPSFCICVGKGQVRVVTLAFVGEPVSGDRPSCKRTPFVLQLTTDDLTQRQPAMSKYSVQPAIEGDSSILEHWQTFEQAIVDVVEDGSWSVCELGEARAASSKAERLRHVGDRASRMRASFNTSQPSAGVASAATACTAYPSAQLTPAPSAHVVDRQARMRASLTKSQPAGGFFGFGRSRADDAGGKTSAQGAAAATPQASKQVVDRAARMRANIRAHAPPCHAGLGEQRAQAPIAVHT